MLVIGLTGGIGSGKSTVAKLFAEHNVPIIDADLIARELVEPEQPALNDLVDAFGPDILLGDGTLDRSQLRNLVFADDCLRKKLENILHPLIRSAMMERLDQVEDSPYTILVVPLLVDTGNWGMIDQILVVDVDEETQIRRVMQRDSVDRKQAQAIIDSQISREFRLEAADQVLRNNGDITSLRNQVELLHQAYLAEAEKDALERPKMFSSRNQLIYELPLIERIRTFLRLEQLFEQVSHYRNNNNIYAAHSAIQTLAEICDLFSRGDFKSEVIKELERQHISLKRHIDYPGINQSVLKKFLKQIEQNIETIHAIREQPEQTLQSDLLYNSVKQRLSIPGGTCGFDLPLYTYWLNNDEKVRKKTLDSWFTPFVSIQNSIEICLGAIRNSADAVECNAVKGFYEHKLKLKNDIQLIRVLLPVRKPYYPTISASKHRLNIRFMEWHPGELKSPQSQADVRFKLMICGI